MDDGWFKWPLYCEEDGVMKVVDGEPALQKHHTAGELQKSDADNCR